MIQKGFGRITVHMLITGDHHYIIIISYHEWSSSKMLNVPWHFSNMHVRPLEIKNESDNKHKGAIQQIVSKIRGSRVVTVWECGYSTVYRPTATDIEFTTTTYKIRMIHHWDNRGPDKGKPPITVTVDGVHVDVDDFMRMFHINNRPCTLTPDNIAIVTDVGMSVTSVTERSGEVHPHGPIDIALAWTVDNVKHDVLVKVESDVGFGAIMK